MFKKEKFEGHEYYCTVCRDIIRSSYPGEYVECSCGSSYVDETEKYIRVGGSAKLMGEIKVTAGQEDLTNLFNTDATADTTIHLPEPSILSTPTAFYEIADWILGKKIREKSWAKEAYIQNILGVWVDHQGKNLDQEELNRLWQGDWEEFISVEEEITDKEASLECVCPNCSNKFRLTLNVFKVK